jgi:uncharacterized protein
MQMKKYPLFIIILFAIALSIPLLSFQDRRAHNPNPDPATAKITPVNFADVIITDQFWKPRLDRLYKVTAWALIDQIEHSPGRLDNFEKVDGLIPGKHIGYFFNDSDVYKTLEALAYMIQLHPDTAIEATADRWIDLIAKAQMKDGYIDTYYELGGIDKRWTDMGMHEMYCAGHLIEAGIAYYHATGKRKLLDVGIRMANHIDSVFGPGKRHWVPGHEEIELALGKLYVLTQDKRYLNLAHWFLEERGHGYGVGGIWEPQNSSWAGVNYCQDNVPVRDINHITGHAVRSMYLFTGMADIGSLTDDTGYIDALKRVWKNLVYKNMYITGGIGSSGNDEGFTHDYDLPNATAYNETCSSVGMVFWNERMNKLTANTKYADVMERTLYNAALSGISLKGNKFFYDNPLASDGKNERQAWFVCACCPPNIARLLASLSGYIYATSPNGIWINLYIGSHGKMEVDNTAVEVNMQTQYPWQGDVKLTLHPSKTAHFNVMLRKPGWCNNFTVSVNGERIPQPVIQNGYIVIPGLWHENDHILLQMEMPVKLISADPHVQADSGRRAIQRGPLVYCLEQPGDTLGLNNITFSPKTTFTVKYQPDLLDGINTVQADNGNASYTMIPYYAWANRTPGSMEVWVKYKEE